MTDKKPTFFNDKRIEKVVQFSPGQAGGVKGAATLRCAIPPEYVFWTWAGRHMCEVDIFLPKTHFNLFLRHLWPFLATCWMSMVQISFAAENHFWRLPLRNGKITETDDNTNDNTSDNHDDDHGIVKGDDVGGSDDNDAHDDDNDDKNNYK